MIITTKMYKTRHTKHSKHTICVYCQIDYQFTHVTIVTQLQAPNCLNFPTETDICAYFVVLNGYSANYTQLKMYDNRAVYNFLAQGLISKRVELGN